MSNSRMDEKEPKLRIEALADSGRSASIILYDFAVKVKTIGEKDPPHLKTHVATR